MVLKLNILIFTAVAAWMDLKWWKVKNLWLAAGMAGGVLFHALCRESTGWGPALTGMILPVLLLGAFYYFRRMGAGDVKLFAVAGFWLGGERSLGFLFTAMVCGAVWFLLLVLKERSVSAVLNRKMHVAVCAFASGLCLIGGIYG